MSEPIGNTEQLPIAWVYPEFMKNIKDEIKKHKFYIAGKELLKKKEKEIDRYLISNLVLEHMTKMGFLRNEVVENLTENYHNNITTTFYLLYNKLKKDKSIKDIKYVINKAGSLSKISFTF